jgi:hypothetical protein
MRPEVQWARDAAVEALTSSPLTAPWAFEYTPASSDGAVQTYLAKVREADIVVWLVGEETTVPVRNEIAEALAADRRLWVVRLPAADRSPETEALLREVGTRVKWGDAADAHELRELLALTFSDEIVRALRQKPGLTRLALLEQLARASRARMVNRWRAAGLATPHAIEFADDLGVGTPRPELLPSATEPLRIVVADVGAGKSVVAERALQTAIVEARDHAHAPVPVFLHARDAAPSLEAAVRLSAEGLGDARLQGAFVVVDGLDEVDEAAASVLISAARVLTEALPATRVLMTSRPTPHTSIAPERRRLEPMTDEETRRLIKRVVGSATERGLGVRWPKPLEPAIHLPLFAILFGLRWRSEGVRGSTTAELLASLVERTIDRERASTAMPYLQQVAVLVTDASGAAVPVGEVGGLGERVALGHSRLIAEEGGTVAFSLPIFAQWFAAQSLLAGTPAISDLAADARRLDRWRYAVAIAIATGAEAFVDEILEALIRADPGFAASVLAESLARWASDEEREHPDVLTAGRQLRRAYESWAAGIGPLRDILLPTMSGELPPLAIDGGGGWLWTGWHDGSELSDRVVRFEERARLQDPPPGWIVRRGGKWNADKGWAWSWSLDDLKHGLAPRLRERSFPVTHAALVDEALWLLALRVARQGSFAQEGVGVPLEPVIAGLRRLPADTQLDLRETVGHADVLLQRAEDLVAGGTTELCSPWPAADLDEVGGWIWNPYSEAQQLARVTAVYAAALSAYAALVDQWFPALRPRLMTAALLPALFVGRYRPGRGTGHEDGPHLEWHLEPLRGDEESRVEIELTHEPRAGRGFDETVAWHEAALERLAALRPEASGWISTTYTWAAAADIFREAPVTAVAYEWLEKDLKRINWSS